MNHALWKKAFHEAMWLLVFCAVGLFAFGWLRVWLVGRVEMSKFAEIIGQLWDDIEKFSTVPLSHLLTYAGRMAVAFNEPVVILLVSVWAVSRGSDVVSGEISRGTMEMLLAQPVSRMGVLWSQAVVGILGVAILCAAIWGGSAVGIAVVDAKEAAPAATFKVPGIKLDLPIPWDMSKKEPIRVPMRDKVSASVLAPATLNLFSLGFFLLGLTTFCSSFDRHRWRTIGIISAAWVIMLVIKGMGMAVDEVAWMQHFSFFTPYSPEWAVYVGTNAPEALWSFSPVRIEGGSSGTSPLVHNAVLLGMGVLFYALAAIIFCRRDLPAPL